MKQIQLRNLNRLADLADRFIENCVIPLVGVMALVAFINGITP